MSMRKTQILIMASLLLAGIALGIVISIIIPLPFREGSTQDQYYSLYQDLSRGLRSYAYLNILYNMKDLVIYTANARIMIMIANITNSTDILALSKTSLETAINTTNRINQDIAIIKVLNISPTERNALDQVGAEVSRVRSSLQNLLNMVTNSIQSKSIDPDLLNASNSVYNDVTQSVDRASNIIQIILS